MLKHSRCPSVLSVGPCLARVWWFPVCHCSVLGWDKDHLSLVPRALSPALLTQPPFFKRFCLLIFRERGREGEREGEKHHV